MEGTGPGDSADRGLALVGVFDVRGISFGEPDFRGCAFSVKSPPGGATAARSVAEAPVAAAPAAETSLADTSV